MYVLGHSTKIVNGIKQVLDDFELICQQISS